MDSMVESKVLGSGKKRQILMYPPDFESTSSEEEGSIEEKRGSFIDEIRVDIQALYKESRQRIRDSYKERNESFISGMRKMKKQFDADIQTIKKDISKMHPG